jgi:hypothetical protein
MCTVMNTATVVALGLATMSLAAPPQVECWLLNEIGRTGYNGLEADVQAVRSNANYVYVSCSSVPAYQIGPWPGNPNTPVDGNWTFRITRNPQPKAAPRTATGLGAIGVWVNGVAIYNASDARSYNNRNIWHQNAIFVEGPSFDGCGGHPAPNQQYHNHQNAACIFDETAALHSSIVGFAFDGYPVYGPYGFTNADGTGAVKMMRSSYRKRNITQRTTLPDGTVLTSANYGPAVGTTYPLGYYIEDYEYVAGLGDLDTSNGRFCVTPEYPQGTYAYFVTYDTAGVPAYPYMIGPTYYGVLDTANTGPTGGRVTPPADAIAYSMFDLDESGQTDFGDISILLLSIGARSPGDIDGDGIVSNGDVALLLLNF